MSTRTWHRIEPQPKPAKGEPPTPTPITTIEDMIREIVRTEVMEAR